MDPVTISKSVASVVQVTIQIVQIVLAWKDAPAEAKAFVEELKTLQMILQETSTSVLWSPEFAEAFQGRRSLLAAHLDAPLLPTSTGTQPADPQPEDAMNLVGHCRKELGELLVKLRERAKGGLLSASRLNGAFVVESTRNAVATLSRRCQMLNQMLLVDSTVIQGRVFKEVTAIREEQQEFHQEEMRGINSLVDNSETKKILDWLTTVSYAPRQTDFLSRRQPGTGKWLLNSAEYQAWLDTPKQTLFCPGIPGAGKTILTSVVVDDLLTRSYTGDARVGIAYVYCNYQRGHEQTIDHLLASLLRQLVEGCPALPESVKDLHQLCTTKGTRPSLIEMSSTLQQTVARYSRVFIVIDALDECTSSNNSRSDLLHGLFDLQEKGKINLFATSRPLPEIVDRFQHGQHLEIRARREDVETYIDGRLPQLPSFVQRNQALQKEIKIVISEAVDGMFLLAYIYLGSLDDKLTPRAVKNALRLFQKQSRGSTADAKVELLARAYEIAMGRINAQKPGLRDMAKKLLSWIVCAKRPLKVLELQHALAVQVDDVELDDDNIPQMADLVSICAGLVTVDSESNVVRLVHYTTQEYFERTKTVWFPDAETIITRTCLTYLSFEKFEWLAKDEADFDARMRSSPLYRYASHEWGFHAREAAKLDPVSIWSQAVQFLKATPKVASSSQPLYDYLRYRQNKDSICAKGLHIVAYFGLEAILHRVLDYERTPDSKDATGRTPLSWAARKGHCNISKFLLETGEVDVNSMDRPYAQTPLQFAAEGGHLDIVRLLLENGAKLEAKASSRTPLYRAIDGGHETIVKLLVERGASLKSEDEVGRTALHTAAQQGHTGIVAFLLAKNGVDPDPPNSKGRRALSYAAEARREAVVELLLLKTGLAHVDDKDHGGMTPLSYAAQVGAIAVLKILLKAGAYVDSMDDCGRTPLNWASILGRRAAVKFLIDEGADIESADFQGLTPMSSARTFGHEAVLNTLLEEGRYKGHGKRGLHFPFYNYQNWP